MKLLEALQTLDRQSKIANPKSRIESELCQVRENLLHGGMYQTVTLYI